MGKTVLEARVVDIEKRRYPSKHYVYVIDVVWSEGTTTTIYRRYSTFFEFQCGLLERFPEEAGFRNPEARMIPFLPGKKIFGRSQVRSVAAKRMAPLDDYCQKLIRLPPNISDNEYVINFFEVKQDDINPPIKKEKKTKKTETISDISDPIVLDQYIVIADYEKKKNNECSISAGQTVEVIDKNENGWWFVHMDDFNEGWIPATYLEPVYGTPNDGHQQVLLESGDEEVHITTSNYQAKNSDELSFERGVLMEVYMKGLDGWWKARYKNDDGFVPACYLTRYYGTISASTSTGVQMVSTVKDAVDSTLKSSSKTPKSSQGTSNQLRSPRSTNSIPSLAGRSVDPGVDPYTDEPIYVPTPRKHDIKKKVVQRPVIVKIPASPTAVDASDSTGDKHEALYEEPGPPTAEVINNYETVSEFYMTIADFQCQVADGLSFKEGVTVSVITKNPSGWYYVEMGDKEGWVPSSYLERTTQSTTTTTTPKATTSPSSKVAQPSSISSNIPLSPTRKTTTSTTTTMKSPSSMQSRPVLPDDRKGVSNKPSFKSRPSENEVQPSSISALATAISNLKPRPQDTEPKVPAISKSPPPKPQLPPRSQGENKVARTRGSLKRSNSSDSLYESTRFVQVHRNSVSPPPARARVVTDITGRPKPMVRKSVSQTSTELSVSKPTKFLRKSEENILAALDSEEKRNTLRPEIVPRNGTIAGKSKGSESVQPTTNNRPPRPAQRVTAQSLRVERAKPAPPPARTAKSYHPQVTGTMRLAELENALQNKKSDNMAVLISKPSTSRKIPTKPTPPSSARAPPKRPQPPTSVSSDKSRKVPPPRPSYSPATSRKPQESYITIADYIGGDGQGSLGFKEGARVEVIEKSDDGWWYVQINEKEGWVPSTFLEKTKPERPKPPRPTQPTLTRTPPKVATKSQPPIPAPKSKNTVVAIGDYTPAAYEDSGIVLVEGETYNVIEKSSEGWWFVRHGNEEGWAPSSFLEPV